MQTSKNSGRNSGGSVLNTIGYIIDGCGTIGMCDDCPINVADNDTECAVYLAKLVLEADWSDCCMTDNGIMPKKYCEASGKA